MMMAAQGKTSKSTTNMAIRPLQAEDLEAVIAIDAIGAGRIRRGFFERRLAAAQKDPKRFIYVGAARDHQLVGFALVHLLDGEYGESGTVAVLDAIGVDPQSRGQGIARALMGRVEAVMGDKKIRELRTESAWTSHDLLSFLDAAGFKLAPRTILSRAVGAPVNW